MKKLQSALSIFLATAFVITSVAPYASYAEELPENPVEQVTEIATEPVTEAPTEPYVEPVTEAPTEPATEAPTTAAQPETTTEAETTTAEEVKYVSNLHIGTEHDFEVYAGLYAQVPDTTTLKVRTLEDMKVWYNYDMTALNKAFTNPIKDKIAAVYELDTEAEDFDSIYKAVYPFEFSLLDKDGAETARFAFSKEGSRIPQRLDISLKFGSVSARLETPPACAR